MNSSTTFNAQVRGWGMLRGLRAAAIDLARLALFRDTTLEEIGIWLVRRDRLAAQLCRPQG